jgi:hypothetical protein
MTITATEAYEAMLAHHARLGEELASRADSVSAAVTAGRPYGAAVAGLIAYLAEEVLPHAAAEEKTVYPAAAAHADMAGMVGEMVACCCRRCWATNPWTWPCSLGTAAALPVRGRARGRIHLGLPGERAGGVAGANRPPR